MLALLVVGAAAANDLTARDLERAHRPKPGPSLRFATERQVSRALNDALRSAWAPLATRPCGDFGLDELHDVIEVLASVRDSRLETIYADAGDRRALPSWMAERAKRQDRRAADAREGPAGLAGLTAARCNDAAFLFAHHLGAEARREAAALLKAAPLVGEEAPTISSSAYAARQLDASMSCRACHYVEDDRNATEHHPVPFPENYNGTMYMYAESHGSTVSAVDYRYPRRQVLYTTTWAEHAGSRDCSLLFESDGSVWEWYRESRRCAKLMDGAPIFPPTLARHAGMTELVSEAPVVFENPFTNESMAPCLLFCAPDDGPCYCESIAAPYQPVLHTHADRNLSGSRSYYAPFVLTPGDVAPIERPDYCPPGDAPAKYANDTTGLECSCNRCWL